MNERFIEIYSRSFTDEQGEYFDARKFAQLIVQECITKAEEEEARFYGMDEDVLASVMQNFQILLKKHFGLK